MAPLPPQFRHTGLSFPSEAVAFCMEIGVPKLFIKDRVEHKQVRQLRREIDDRESCGENNKS